MKNIKVKLLTHTPNLLDVVYTGARVCYSKQNPIDMWFDVCNIPTDKKINFVKNIITSKHLSVLEHSSFTFAISGVSRAFLAQITRHRLCSFSVQSQRYVEIKEDQKELEDLFLGSSEEYKKLYPILNKYFVDGDKSKNVNGYYYALDNYLEATKNGEKAEDARRFLPNSTRTNMVLTCNLRELMHICNERLCNHAQYEIRKVVQMMVDEVLKDNEWLQDYLQPKCCNGICTEKNSCGLVKKFQK